jgi:hypothetical protein
MTRIDTMNNWDFKLVRAAAIVVAFTNAVTLLYEVGFAKGYDAAGTVVSDFGFFHWLNRLHLGITTGLIITAVGLCLSRRRGLLVSGAGLTLVAAVYGWWYSRTQAFILNSEVTPYTRTHDPYYSLLLFHGANWWDMFILVLTVSMLIWVVVALLRNAIHTVDGA